MIQYIIIYIILVLFGIFVSIDKKKERMKLVIEELENGEKVQKIVKEKYLEFGIVSDERICDRTLFFKLLKKTYKIS